MGGMGPNISDVPSMLLLPELLFRWAFGKPLLRVPAESSAPPDGVPGLNGGPTGWERSWCPAPTSILPAAARRLGARATRPVRRLARAVVPARPTVRPVGYLSLDWQPATWYRPWWRRMPAFALPSFYDGRVRVNLRGREANGVVDLADYTAVCDEIEALRSACANPRTGEPIVEAVERTAPDDPLALDSSGADLAIVWHDSTNAFDHPEHGLIGPVPYLRTGGHTGPHGFALISGPGIVPGDHGVASSFDVAPTILDLLGRGDRDEISGTSLLPRLARQPSG